MLNMHVKWGIGPHVEHGSHEPIYKNLRSCTITINGAMIKTTFKHIRVKKSTVIVSEDAKDLTIILAKGN